MPRSSQPEVVKEVLQEFARDPSPLSEVERVGLSAALDPFTRWINQLHRAGFAPKVVDSMVSKKIVLKTKKIPSRRDSGEPRKHEVAVRQARPIKIVYVRKVGGVPGPIPKGVNIAFY